MKNFHVPLPEELYADLRAIAHRSQVPATSLAREAIETWLRAKAREARHAAIAAYASEAGGTSADLDPAMEAAGIEHLLNSSKES